MSTTNTLPPSPVQQLPVQQVPVQQLIEQRLDAIDQALLGLLPLTQKRRSRLAISAGILGALALALLLAIPVTYIAVEVMGDVLGEFISIGLLGVHSVAVSIGGLAAVGLGIAALVSLRRHKENLVGHGWAIAGLCTGPLPMLLGFAAVLFLVLQGGLLAFFTSSECTETCVAESPTEPSNGSGPEPVYLRASSEQPPQPMSCQPPVCYAPPSQVLSCPSPVCHAGNAAPACLPCPSDAEPCAVAATSRLTEVRLLAAEPGEPQTGEQHYRIGVQLAEADETLRSQLRLAAGEGLVVTEVLQESPAAMAGLQNHDVLTKLDGKRLTKIEAVNGQIQEIRDRKVSVSLFRGGNEITCDVTPTLATEPSFTVSFVGSLDGSVRLQEAGPGAAQFVVEFTSESPAREPARPTAAEQLVILKTQLAEVHKSLAALEAALQPAPEEKK